MRIEKSPNIKSLETELEKYIENEEAFIKTKLYESINLKTEIVKYFSKFEIDLDEKDISFIEIDERLKFKDLEYEYNCLFLRTITISYYVAIKSLNLNLKITVSNFDEFKNRVDNRYSVYIHNIF